MFRFLYLNQLHVYDCECSIEYRHHTSKLMSTLSALCTLIEYVPVKDYACFGLALIVEL